MARTRVPPLREHAGVHIEGGRYSEGWVVDERDRGTFTSRLSSPRANGFLIVSDSAATIT